MRAALYNCGWIKTALCAPPPLTNRLSQGAPTSYAYFTACLHRNLRVAVSLDPSSEAFSRRLEQNPALLSCCSMLWWQGWSDASLTAIAQLRLQVRANLVGIVCMHMVAALRAVRPP